MNESSKTVMTVEEMGEALHISKSKAYELIHSQFSPPVIHIGRVSASPSRASRRGSQSIAGRGSQYDAFTSDSSEMPRMYVRLCPRSPSLPDAGLSCLSV